MTLSTLQNRFSFAGNGVTTIFPFNAKFIKETDLVVLEVDDTTKAEVEKDLTTHYTVSGGNNATGSVTMLVAPAAGKTLVVYRDTSVDQDLDLIENDRLPVEEIEKRFDKLTQIAQRIKEKVLRSIGFREGFTGTFNLTLPIGIDDVANAGKTLAINATSDGLELGASTADIANAQQNAIDAAASAAAAAASAAAAAAAIAYTITAIDVTGGNQSFVLPSAAANAGKTFAVLNKSFGSANVVNVSPTGGDTINGAATDVVGAGETTYYYSDGTAYFVI